jgi:hypothetical protein
MAANQRKLTSFERSIPDYRSRLLLSLGKALLIPPLLSLAILCLVLGLPLNIPSVAASVLAIPLTISTRSHLSLWAHYKAARSLNATIIPRVKGRWPGNLDIALRVTKSFKEEYVFQIFADLFCEYGATTLNMRLFWDDQVTMDSISCMFYLTLIRSRS